MTWRAATLAALLVGSVSGTECTDFTYADGNARYGSQIWEEPHGGYELFEDLYVTPCTIVKFSYGSNHVRAFLVAACLVASAAKRRIVFEELCVCISVSVHHPDGASRTCG